MDTVFKYYEFTDFFTDKSTIFSGNEICFSELNKEHFLIFEKKENRFNLYVSKYNSKKEIGFTPPEILELLVEDYDKSVPEHRIILKKYFKLV